MKKHFLKIAALASLMSMAGTSQATIQPSQQAIQKDAIDKLQKQSTINQMVRSGMNNGWAEIAGESRVLNQRQYRKKVRSNQSLYKSRKHRSKN